MSRKTVGSQSQETGQEGRSRSDPKRLSTHKGGPGLLWRSPIFHLYKASFSPRITFLQSPPKLEGRWTASLTPTLMQIRNLSLSDLPASKYQSPTRNWTPLPGFWHRPVGAAEEPWLHRPLQVEASAVDAGMLALICLRDRRIK